MESEQKNETDYVWPPSNYPIFLALVLLAAMVVTLAMGDELRAEELAIYAYYLLVIGVAIRFFELSLPENALVRLGVVKVRFLGWMLWLVQRIWDISRNIGSKLRLLVVKIPEVKISNIHRDGFNTISYWFDVSKNATIFLALLLFVVSAVTLALGDDKRAEELVIYAFSLLVIRLALHFLEISLTENTLTKLRVIKVRFLGWMVDRPRGYGILVEGSALN
jgi:hypothetical protein